MQKKLIALAVAGLASSAAFAQSNVTIYGVLKPSYDFMDVDAADRTTDMNWNNSRIGFKGSEDLGNGLKAIFQIESKVKLTEKGDGAAIADRDSWAGLAGSFGSLTFGNHQSAYVKASASYDPFADTIADYNNIMGVFGGNGDDGADIDFNNRWSKSAYYTSPNFNGFKVVASYSLNSANKTGSESDDVSSIAATYTNGGLGLLAGYENQSHSAGVDDAKAWKVGATYKFAFGTKVSGIYENMQLDSADVDVDHYYLAVVHPITSNVDLAATYIHASESNNGADDGANNWNVGVNYKLSKRTSVKGLYTNINNKTNGTYFADAGYGQGNTAPGKDVSGFSVQLVHNF